MQYKIGIIDENGFVEHVETVYIQKNNKGMLYEAIENGLSGLFGTCDMCYAYADESILHTKGIDTFCPICEKKKNDKNNFS